MRKLVAGIAGIVVALLSVSGAAQAQGYIRMNGTIQGFDCRANSLVLNARDGVHVLPMAPGAVAYVNGAPIGFCGLRQFTGSYAVAAVGANQGQFFAARVDVYPAGAYPPPPAYYSGPPYPYYYGPPVGIGIGIGFGFGCCRWHR